MINLLVQNLERFLILRARSLDASCFKLMLNFLFFIFYVVFRLLNLNLLD